MQSYILRMEKDRSAKKSLSPKNQKLNMSLSVIKYRHQIFGLVFVYLYEQINS